MLKLLLYLSYRRMCVECNIIQLFLFYMLAMDLFIVLLMAEFGTVSSVNLVRKPGFRNQHHHVGSLTRSQHVLSPHVLSMPTASIKPLRFNLIGHR